MREKRDWAGHVVRIREGWSLLKIRTGKLQEGDL
jgi:hypothetical protein